MTFDGFLTSVITISNAPLKLAEGSGADCGATATMSVQYRLNEVLPGLYVTR
jgi:hypothetical protein